VPAFRIVEALDVVEYISSRLISGPVRFAPCALGLQRREEAFDRGSQYTSEQFQELMAITAVCSIAVSGNVWGQCPMESFFSSLKTERTGRKTYRTRDEARADIFDYIECFYNPKCSTRRSDI